LHWLGCIAKEATGTTVLGPSPLAANAQQARRRGLLLEAGASEARGRIMTRRDVSMVVEIAGRRVKASHAVGEVCVKPCELACPLGDFGAHPEAASTEG
jgi:hypothetical protein